MLQWSQPLHAKICPACQENQNNLLKQQWKEEKRKKKNAKALSDTTQIPSHSRSQPQPRSVPVPASAPSVSVSQPVRPQLSKRKKGKKGKNGKNGHSTKHEVISDDSADPRYARMVQFANLCPYQHASKQNNGSTAVTTSVPRHASHESLTIPTSGATYESFIRLMQVGRCQLEYSFRCF